MDTNIVSGSWDEWKQQLAQAVQLGEKMNIAPEQIAERAEQVGDFLANRVDPRNPEQKVLKELWQAADEEEQRTIAGVIINMVAGQQNH